MSVLLVVSLNPNLQCHNTFAHPTFRLCCTFRPIVAAGRPVRSQEDPIRRACPHGCVNRDRHRFLKRALFWLWIPTAVTMTVCGDGFVAGQGAAGRAAGSPGRSTGCRSTSATTTTTTSSTPRSGYASPCPGSRCETEMPDPDGVSAFHTYWTRLGWAPSGPRGRWCPRGHEPDGSIAVSRSQRLRGRVTRFSGRQASAPHHRQRVSGAGARLQIPVSIVARDCADDSPERRAAVGTPPPFSPGQLRALESQTVYRYHRPDR